MRAVLTSLFVLFAVVLAVIQAAGLPDYAKWASVDSDNTGRYILAVSLDEGVYVSSDYGINWTKAMIGCDSFTSGSISGSGKYMLVGTYCLQSVGSSDFGQTWTAVTLPRDFTNHKMDVSETGQYQVAGSFVPNALGQIQVSQDFGKTWAKGSETVTNLASLAMSAVGDHIYLGPLVGSFEHSKDYGKTFEKTTFKTYQGGLLSCDANCEHMAYTNYQQLMMSSNNGTSFEEATAPKGVMADVALSASGQYVYLAMSNSDIYLSTNYGKVFTKTDSGVGAWTSLTTDSTGKVVTAAINNGHIITSQDFGETWQY